MKRPALALALPAVLLLAACDGSGSSAAPAPTVTVTATETVTAEPTQPDESYSGPVEGEPATNTGAGGGAFKLGEPYTLEDGSTITIGLPEPITVDSPEDGMDAHYKFLVSYTNNGEEPWSPLNLTVEGTTGTTATPTFLSGSNDCSLMTTDVLPGKTLEWPICIGARKADGLTLQWSVLFGGKGWVDVELP